jgi:hypothetical protein
MKIHSRAILVIMIVLYMLSVRFIFAWLARSDSFPITARFPYDIWSAIPVVIGLTCAVGIATRQAWAWWLALGAIAYELVTFSASLFRIFGFTASGALGTFKFLWLLSMLALLVAVRRR